MEQSCRILNEYYANLRVLDNNLQNMSCNLIGSSFFGLNKKLEEYGSMVRTFYGLVAKRIRMLDGYPLTSLNKIEDVSTFKSMCSMDFTGQQVFEVLENDFRFIVEFSKDLVHHFEEIKDPYSMQMLLQQYCFFEEQLWMIHTNLK